MRGETEAEAAGDIQYCVNQLTSGAGQKRRFILTTQSNFLFNREMFCNSSKITGSNRGYLLLLLSSQFPRLRIGQRRGKKVLIIRRLQGEVMRNRNEKQRE